jgi:hypothetical protein
VTGRLLPILICTGILCLAFAIPHTRDTQADVPQVPLAQFDQLDRQFGALKADHESLRTDHQKVLQDLNFTKMLFLDVKTKFEREQRRRKFVEIMEEKGHKVCLKHQYYLYDLVESLVMGYFINDPVVMEILADPEHHRREMSDPAALIAAMMDAESGLHSITTSKRYKRGGKGFYDVGLFQIQIPEWTNDKRVIRWFASLGVIPNDGKWHLGIALERLKDPWKNSEVFAKCFIPELKRYRDLRLALTRYNSWLPKGTDKDTLLAKLEAKDYRWASRHLNDVYYREVKTRYDFYVTRFPVKFTAHKGGGGKGA